MPRFSIVITCTRPRLVGSALTSALAQDFADFEIVVSDNSADSCREVVESFGDSRICYARPDDYLTTVPHWNFAFSHAVGEWQLLLCDDDAIAPNLLTILDDAIRAHPEVDSIKWEFGAYIDPVDSSEQRGSFTIPAFSGQHEIRSTAEILRDMFASGAGNQPLIPGGQSVKRRIPLLTHAVYARPLVDRIRGAFGGVLFLPICPMTTAAAAALALSQKTLRIDLPLSVIGQTLDSAANHMIDPTTFERMHRGTSFEHVPIKSMSIFPTIRAESLLRASAAIPELLSRYELDWARYFSACYLAADRAAADASFIAEMTRIIDVALAEFPASTREAVYTLRAADKKAAVESSAPGLPTRIFRQLIILPRRLGARIGFCKYPLGRLLDPERLGLKSVSDCAFYLGSIIR